MHTKFSSRDFEIAKLQEAFAHVNSQSPQPQLVVLLGDSGIGKTRIAQEFFKWLSYANDPSNYWPADFGRLADYVGVNPEPERCDNSEGMEFLWWGIRLPDDIAPGALFPHLRFLQPHLEPFYDACRRDRRMKAGRKSILTALVDIILSLIPGVGAIGPIKSGVTAAFEITSLIRENIEDHRSMDTAMLANQISRGVVETVMADLELLFGSDSAKRNIPAVFLIDDAHFSSNDHATVDFLRKLMDRAWLKKWPLLIVITHWEQEWNLDLQGKADSVASVIRTHTDRFEPDWKPLLVKPADNLAPMLEAKFPGLTKLQVKALLDRAAGVPAHLQLMMELCSIRPNYFHSQNISKQLTDAGLAELLGESLDRANLIEKRLNDESIPKSVRHALIIASLQGMRFSCEVTEGVADAIGLAGVRQGLDLAENPHSYVFGVANPVAEFKMRATQEVAFRLLPHHVDGQAVITALTNILRKFIGDRERFLSRSQSEREVLAFTSAAFLEGSPDPDDRSHARRALGELAFVYLERGNLEDATRAYERLLKTQPSLTWVMESEWQDRFGTLEFLAMAYRKLDWPSKLSSAYKGMIWLAHSQLSDDRMRAFVFSRNPLEVRKIYESWMEEHLPKIIEIVRSQHQDSVDSIPEEFVTRQLEEGYCESAKALVLGLLGLAELAKEWPELRFADGDDPISDTPFMVKALRTDDFEEVPIDSKFIAESFTERAYNIGTIISDSYSKIEHYKLLVDDIARTHSDAGRYNKAIDYLERAKEIAIEIKDPILQIQALQNLGLVHGQKGDRLESEKILINEAGQCINDLNSRGTFRVVMVHHNGAVKHVRFEEEDPPNEKNIIRWLDFPIALSDDFDQSAEKAVGRFWKLVTIVGNIYGNLGICALEDGDLEKAEERFKSAMDNYYDLNDGPNIAITWMNMAKISRGRGDTKSTSDHLRRALTVYEKLASADEGRANAIVWHERIDEVRGMIEKEEIV